MKRDQEDDIFDFIDGRMDAGERARFEALMNQDAALKRKVEEQAALNQMLKNTLVEAPAHHFTASVWAQIEHDKLKYKQLRRGLILLCCTVSIMALTVFVLYAGLLDKAGLTVDPAALSIHETLKVERLPTLAIDGRGLTQIIIIVNMTLAFIILDRTILQPLFHRRAPGRE